MDSSQAGTFSSQTEWTCSGNDVALLLYQENAKALSTVTGIIDGTGSIGAALIQSLVGYLANCQYELKGSNPKNPHCVQVCSWSPAFVFLYCFIVCLSNNSCILKILPDRTAAFTYK
ncbi:hypothetical protein Plhal304r1_c008g0031131 [Plasmopara halstedii]